MIKAAVFFCSLLLVTSVSFAAGDENEEGKKEEIQSLTDDRREILLYGIDTQVLELIDDLVEEKDTELIGEVHAAFKTTRNPKIKTSILNYFEELEYRGAADDALKILENSEEEETSLLLASVRYLTVDPSPELGKLLEPLLESPDQEIVRVALKGIGLSGGENTVDLLLEYLDDSDFPSNLKPDILIALGDLKDKKAIDPLIDILEDDGEDGTWRRYACASLGKIGDPSVLPIIEKTLFDDDANLRSYAVGALQYFDSGDVVPLLITALKDSFWRVRVNAAKSLGELQAEQAEEILVFKAEKDPEMNVRQEAVRALGNIKTQGSFDFLREIYEREVTPPVLRYLAAEILSREDLANSIDSFTRVIHEHWDKDNSKVLERSAYYLSLSVGDGLEPLFSKFLDSGEIVIIIYGIRGAAKNKIMSLRPAVEKLSEEGNHRSIRKAALAALESF